MKPVESYSAINARMDRPTVKDAVAQKTDSANPTDQKKGSEATTTTASQLAAEKAPFDVKKVSELREKIATGNYHVNTDALAEKMLEVGVIGVDSKK